MSKQECMERCAWSTIQLLEGREDDPVHEGDLMSNALLYGYVLEYLRPDWFRNEKHGPAFEALLKQLRKHRDKVGKDVEFIQIARQHEMFLDGPEGLVYGDPDKAHIQMFLGLISPADLGMCFSRDSKDRKAMRQAFLQYLRRAFPPQPIKSPATLKREGKKAVSKLTGLLPPSAPPLNREARRALANGRIPFPEPGFLPPLQIKAFHESLPGEKDDLEDDEDENDPEVDAFFDEMWRYSIILAGEIGLAGCLSDEARWEYVSLEDGSDEVDLTSRWAREAACLRPTADACASCQPEFRRLLSTIYYVRESGLSTAPLYKRVGEERERYFRQAEAVVAPFVKVLSADGTSQQELTGNALLRNQELEEELSQANQTIKELQAHLAEASKQAAAPELAQLQDEASRAKQALKSQEQTLERLKEDAASLKQEKERLLRALSDSQSQFNSMNEQLLDLVEEKFDFLDDEIPEAPVAPAGIRAKIGEGAYQLLSNTRLAVVGGHDNTTTSLRGLFPDWKFFPTNTIVPDGLTSVDAMAIIATYVSHKTYEQAKSVSKGIGMRVIPVMHNSPVSICRTLADLLDRKASAAS